MFNDKTTANQGFILGIMPYEYHIIILLPSGWHGNNQECNILVITNEKY